MIYILAKYIVLAMGTPISKTEWQEMDWQLLNLEISMMRLKRQVHR